MSSEKEVAPPPVAVVEIPTMGLSAKVSNGIANFFYRQALINFPFDKTFIGPLPDLSGLYIAFIHQMHYVIVASLFEIAAKLGGEGRA